MPNVSDQIKDLENTRAAKVARMEEVAKKSMEAGRSMEDDEAEEFDGLEAEVKQIDGDITRLRKLEGFTAQRATPVAGKSGAEAGSSRGGQAGPTIIVKNSDAEEKFKGQNYTRMVIAKALARLEDSNPVAIAMQRWGKSNPQLVQVIKAAVAGGGTGQGEWGAELVQADARYTGDFIEFLYGQTVFDKLPLRQVPANVTIKGQDGSATGYWVGESKAIPATKADFNTVTLRPLKVAALAVVSNELLRDSTPAAEELVRDALVQASAQRVDQTFLSTAAGVEGVSPAGILNGLAAIASSGNDIASVIEDVKALYATFIAAKNAAGLQFVTTPALGKALSLMQNALGNFGFPGIGANGGALLGDPVVTGDNVAEGNLILLKPSDIYRIGDYGIQVSISREASIEQDTAPTGATDTPTGVSPTNLTSMFQEESTAIKVVRPINFAKRRNSAVAFVSGAAYGDPVASGG
jgi:HK97 family phage major capsid protein